MLAPWLTGAAIALVALPSLAGTPFRPGYPNRPKFHVNGSLPAADVRAILAAVKAERHVTDKIVYKIDVKSSTSVEAYTGVFYYEYNGSGDWVGLKKKNGRWVITDYGVWAD